MTDRERLARWLFNTAVGRDIGRTFDTLASHEHWLERAERLLAMGVTLPPETPAPRPDWPGLDKAVEAYRNAPYDVSCCHFTLTPGCPKCDDEQRAGLNAAAPVLWRAMVAHLSPAINNEGGIWAGIPPYWRIPRAPLAALADPYDGGGK